MKTYLYAFNMYAWFDKVFLLNDADKKLKAWDLIQNWEWYYFLVLGEEISFPEVYNTIYSSDGTDKEYTAEYALDKKYTLLKGRVAPALGFNKDASVKVEVICDGKTEATYTIKASDYYSSIDVDVTGVSKLVFKVTPAEGDKLDKTSILISKVTLDKAEEKTEEKKEDGEKPTEAEKKAEAATTTEKAE